MATHSSILTWKIPWTEETGGHKELGTIKRLSTGQHVVSLSSNVMEYTSLQFQNKKNSRLIFMNFPITAS